MTATNNFDKMQQILKLVEGTLGKEVFSDPKRFKACLADVSNLPESRLLNNLLKTAICDMKAYDRLKKFYEQGNMFAVTNLAKEMEKDYGKHIDLTTDTMEAIGELVGYKQRAFRPTYQSDEELKNFEQECRTGQKERGGSNIKFDSIKFGGHDWIILEIRDGKTLLLSEKILERRAYHNSQANVAWEQCTLRKYLNSEFYNSFHPDYRSKIVHTYITNSKNLWYGTFCGRNTNDYIFLLSLEEVVRYFGDTGQLKTRPNNYAKCIDDEYNNSRAAYTDKGETSWWWLRCLGSSTGNVADVLSDGRINIDGVNVINDNGGVRPALWIKL